MPVPYDAECYMLWIHVTHAMIRYKVRVLRLQTDQDNMASLPGKTHTQNYGMRSRGSGKGTDINRGKPKGDKEGKRGATWLETRQEKTRREEKYSTMVHS
jgi:hypothetical protein